MTTSPGADRERSFGLAVGTVCGLLAVHALWRGSSDSSWVLGTLAVSLIGLALTHPSWLRVPSAFWWRVARALGWLNSRILLSAFFFLVLTPVGLLARGGGWDPLRLRRRPSGSGWLPYAKRGAKHYERMY